MKRQWRAGRIILAVLLLSLASLAFYVWPIGPRWHYLDEHLLAFDLNQGLLFTTYVKDYHAEETELHGFDLVTGERKVCMSFLREKIGQGEGNVIWCWSILSPDSSRLAYLKSPLYTLHMVDVQNQCQRIFSIKVDDVQSIGFSSDGRLLAFGCSEVVSVLDCQTGKIIKRLTMPVGTAAPSGYGRQEGTARFSGDGRLLAVAGLDSILVFDLALDRMIGQCPQASIPVFLSDNTTLLALPRKFIKSEFRFAKYSELPQPTSFDKPSWHSLDGEELRRMNARPYRL